MDEILAHKDEAYCRGVNLADARQNGIISAREANRLVEREQRKLHHAGYHDLFPKLTHYLLSLRHSGKLVLGPDGKPAVRICNFSLIQKL